MLLSHRKKFIFTKTSKTASTSIEFYYEPLCMPKGEWVQSHGRDEHISKAGIIGYRGTDSKGCTYYNHMGASRIKELVGDEIWDSYFKFTVVRNPFSKLVSGWYHFFKPKIKHKRIQENNLKESEYDIYSFREWLVNGGCIIDRDK